MEKWHQWCKKKKEKYQTCLKLCLHVTFACAAVSTSAWRFVLSKWWRKCTRREWVSTHSLHVRLCHHWPNANLHADVDAHVTCKQALRPHCLEGATVFGCGIKQHSSIWIHLTITWNFYFDLKCFQKHFQFLRAKISSFSCGFLKENGQIVGWRPPLGSPGSASVLFSNLVQNLFTTTASNRPLYMRNPLF